MGLEVEPNLEVSGPDVIQSLFALVSVDIQTE